MLVRGVRICSGEARLARVALLLCLALLGAALAPSNAPAQTAAELSVLQVDDSAFPQISAVVAVTSGGRPLTNLGAPDFAVTDDTGAAAAISAVNPAADAAVPVGVVIAIDRSGSMSEPIGPGQGSKIDAVRQAAKTLIGQLGSADQVGIVSFATDVATQQAITADHAAAQQAVDQIPAPLGWTALYDAAATAIDEAHRSGLRRTAVVLLTDGDEEGSGGAPSSRSGQQDVIDRANQDGVALLTVGVGPDQNAGVLRTFAAATGGTYSSADDAAGVQQAFTAAAQTLRTQYTVKFRVNTPAASRSHTFQMHVTLPGGASAGASAAFKSKPVPPLLEIDARPAGGSPTALKDGETLKLDVTRTLQFNADAPGGIANVQYTLDDQPPVVLTSAPFVSPPLDPLMLQVGSHQLTAEATDVAGNVVSQHLSLSVPALPPPVQLPGIVPNSTLKGTVVIRPQIASKQGTIRQAVYQLDKRSPQTFTTPPFSYALDTSTLSRGNHRLAVTVTDTNGQQGVNDLPFRLAGAAFNPFLLIVFGAAALVMIALVAIAVAHRNRGRRAPVRGAAGLVAEAAAIVPVGAEPVAAGAVVAPVAAGGWPPQMTASAPAFIEVQRDGGSESVAVPEGAALLIGREQDCGLRLDDSRVSRHHAQIAQVDGGYWFTDLGSKAGSWCDGARVQRDRSAPLHDGSQIRIGPCALVFHCS